MAHEDKRDYPRLDIHTEQRILYLSDNQELVKNVVLSQNLSATGFCFQSSRPYRCHDKILVHLNDEVFEDIKVNRAGVLKFGKHFLAKIVWTHLDETSNEPIYTVGCAFFNKKEKSSENIELFTRLINLFTVEHMAIA